MSQATVLKTTIPAASLAWGTTLGILLWVLIVFAVFEVKIALDEYIYRVGSSSDWLVRPPFYGRKS
jgi:hypothetical protein